MLTAGPMPESLSVCKVAAWAGVFEEAPEKPGRSQAMGCTRPDCRIGPTTDAAGAALGCRAETAAVGSWAGYWLACAGLACHWDCMLSRVAGREN